MKPVAMLARDLGVTVHEARVLTLAYQFKQKKPYEPDAVCVAAARWVLPYMIGQADRTAK